MSSSPPSALDLVVEWINTNTKYKAQASAKGEVIVIESPIQKGWLYLDAYKRWAVQPGLYLMADIVKSVEFREWNPRKVPPLGDPDFFKVLMEHLDNGPKPF